MRQLQLQTQTPPEWDGLGHTKNLFTDGSGGSSRDTQDMQLPSPTLTNPDLVLPDERAPIRARSVQRVQRKPVNPSYLRDKTNEVANLNSTQGSNGTGDASDSGLHRDLGDKRGLLSRKMMLARSSSGTPSATNTPQLGEKTDIEGHFGGFDGVHGHAHDQSNGATVPSSPIINNNASTGLLAPATVDDRRVSSGSSYNSDDLKAAQQFLSKYGPGSGDATDDESVTGKDDAATKKPGEIGFSSAASIAENDLDSRRREQQIEEQNSAMLSQRAEQILANAKKRLNLMEGNLRGARDLVTPLTAANLKRATSLGSSHIPSASVGTRSRLMLEAYHNENNSSNGLPHPRLLHSQASSPTIGRDYRTAVHNYPASHSRGFSETELPGRLTPSLSRQSSLARHGRFPVKVSDGNIDMSRMLRGSRSFDALSSFQRAPSREGFFLKSSPDSNLDTLPEDDDNGQAPQIGSSYTHPSTYGLGLYEPQSAVEQGPYGGRTLWRSQSVAENLRSTESEQLISQSPHYTSSYREYWHTRQATDTFKPTPSVTEHRQSSMYGYNADGQSSASEPYPRSSSAASELRTQMNSLKGRISSLRDRARQDSMRRRSMQSLRTPSPLNNATSDAPETFYMESEGYGSPVRDTNGGLGWTTNGSPNWEKQRVHRSVSSSNSHEERNTREAQSAPVPQGQWTGPERTNRNGSAEEEEEEKGEKEEDWQSRHSESPNRPRTAHYQPQHQSFPTWGLQGNRIAYDLDSGNAFAAEQRRTSLAQHQRNDSRDSHDSYDDYEAAEDEQDDEAEETDDETVSETSTEQTHDEERYGDENDPVNDPEAESIYEDALTSPPLDIAHEDRADAFDYQQFFLSSAMAVYGNRARSESRSSEESDASSTETARAPQSGNADEVDDEDDVYDDERRRQFPPPTPQTPEELREIERRNLRLLHQRTLSNESISTINSFATAAEAREASPSPAMMLRKATAGTAKKAEPIWRQLPAPGTSIVFTSPLAVNKTDGSEDGSPDRADSGVGFTRRNTKVAPQNSLPSSTITTGPSRVQDPVTVAVHALLHPDKATLGLKDKAMVFELVEALRKVVGELQQPQTSSTVQTRETEAPRSRLTAARKALEARENGSAMVKGRPGTA